MEKGNLLQTLLNPVAKDDVEKLYGPSEGLKAGEKPLYLQAAEARAKRLGISAQQLLETYSKRLKESKYPTPECLPVDRLQAYASGSALSEGEKSHIATCEDCSRVLEEVQPSEEILQLLIEEVRLLAVEATASMREYSSNRTAARAQIFR